MLFCIIDVIAYVVGIWHDGILRFDILYGKNTVWDMWDNNMLVVWYMGKAPYVVWYVLSVWYGKNTVYGVVRLRYGTMVRCRGCIIRLKLPEGMVCFSRL